MRLEMYECQSGVMAALQFSKLTAPVRTRSLAPIRRCVAVVADEPHKLGVSGSNPDIPTISPSAWNGRQGGLKIRCVSRVGSSPTSGTKRRIQQ